MTAPLRTGVLSVQNPSPSGRAGAGRGLSPRSRPMDDPREAGWSQIGMAATCFVPRDPHRTRGAALCVPEQQDAQRPPLREAWGLILPREGEDVTGDTRGGWH